jgi:hypothetical protein
LKALELATRHGGVLGEAVVVAVNLLEGVHLAERRYPQDAERRSADDETDNER